MLRAVGCGFYNCLYNYGNVTVTFWMLQLWIEKQTQTEPTGTGPIEKSKNNFQMRSIYWLLHRLIKANIDKWSLIGRVSEFPKITLFIVVDIRKHEHIVESCAIIIQEMCRLPT